MEITNQDTKSPTISIEIPKGHEPQYTQVGDYIKITFEPKEEPKLPKSLGELGKIDGYSTHNLVWPTEKESNAARALSQLLQLRNAYSGKHMRDRDPNDCGFMVNDAYPFTFPTVELRDRFQTQFADLIRIASPLL